MQTDRQTDTHTHGYITQLQTVHGDLQTLQLYLFITAHDVMRELHVLKHSLQFTSKTGATLYNNTHVYETHRPEYFINLV